MAALKITIDDIFPNSKEVKKRLAAYIKALKKAEKAHKALEKAMNKK